MSDALGRCVDDQIDLMAEDQVHQVGGVILDLVDKWKEGYDVVYAQRIDREGVTKMRKLIDLTTYRVINFL